MNCPTCGAGPFKNAKALAGHIGGKHGDLSFGKRERVEHGTNKGYQWHIRRKVPFEGCTCKAAHAKFMSNYRAKRRAWGPSSS